jgi:hypothetical protein
MSFHTSDPHSKAVQIPGNSYCLVTIHNGQAIAKGAMRNAYKEGATIIEDSWYVYTNATTLVDTGMTNITSYVNLIGSIVDALYDFVEDYYKNILNIATVPSSSNLAAIYT